MQVKRDIQWLNKLDFTGQYGFLWLKMFSIFWRSYRCHHDSGSKKITFKDSWCLKATWFKKKNSKSKRYLPSRSHFTSENRVSISQSGPRKHWGLVKEREGRRKENENLMDHLRKQKKKKRTNQPTKKTTNKQTNKKQPKNSTCSYTWKWQKATDMN